MPRTAKLFRNGRSQAVRLPSEYRFALRKFMSAVISPPAMSSSRAARNPGRIFSS